VHVCFADVFCCEAERWHFIANTNLNAYLTFCSLCMTSGFTISSLCCENLRSTVIWADLLNMCIIQRATERTPRFGSGIARAGVGQSSGECVVRQLCSCLSQFTPRFFCRGVHSKWRFADNDAACLSYPLSGTGLTITLGNFTKGRSAAPRLPRGVPFLSLVCGVRTILKRTMLL
jgi:hypothetical protein